MPGSFGPLDLPPSGSTDFFEYELPPASSASADETVEGTLCLAYERIALDEASTWVEEQRFEYRRGSNTVAVLDQVNATIPRDTPACVAPVAAALR